MLLLRFLLVYPSRDIQVATGSECKDRETQTEDSNLKIVIIWVLDEPRILEEFT